MELRYIGVCLPSWRTYNLLAWRGVDLSPIGHQAIDMRISIFEGAEQVEYIELPGDVSDYDIIINSSTPVDFPPSRLEGEPPEVPELEIESIEKETNRGIYKRMRDNPESQPAVIRRRIYQNQLLTRKQLDAWLESEGYAPRGGAVKSSLIVLESLTDEINRIGDGENMEIVWTGET